MKFMFQAAPITTIGYTLGKPAVLPVKKDSFIQGIFLSLNGCESILSKIDALTSKFCKLIGGLLSDIDSNLGLKLLCIPFVAGSVNASVCYEQYLKPGMCPVGKRMA
jgi:hypothetical protein